MFYFTPCCLILKGGKALSNKSFIMVLILSILLVSVFSPALSATSRKDLVVNYLLNHYDKEEGAFFLTKGGHLSIKVSYYAYSALSLLEIEDFDEKVNTTIMSDWLKNRQISDKESPNYGAFSEPESDHVDIYASMYAVLLLDKLNKLEDEDLINKTALISWVNSCYNEDGSFSMAPGDKSSLSTTYAALMILNSLNAVDDIVNKTITINWIKNLQLLAENSSNYGGFAMFPNSTDVSLDAAYMAWKSLRILNAEDEIDTNSLKAWVISLYNDSGFFYRDAEKEIYNIYLTYYGVLLLKEFGELSGKKEAIVSWVLSLQRSDGGFTYYDEMESNPIATSLALLILAELDALSSLNEASPWVWGGYTFFQVLGITILVVILAVIGGYIIKIKYRKR